ncbi:MAG: hypothetical protein AUH85_13725 [Chloroflexi bacterium 13_1_40CM_4_68_4]|nr:MAG: hypothetical protein AUH85_13725 [Chloroflexi bacterium 13_1_40CM_4_68_4]
MSDVRSRLFLVVGLGLAAITGLLLYGTLTASAGSHAVARLDVVVTRAAIAANTPLTAALLDARSYPAELVPSGALSDTTGLIGQRLAVALPEGVPILRAFLSGVAGQTSTAYAPQPGQVVTTFSTSDPLTLAGLVQVGDHIDILATVAAGSDGRITQTTVRDLEVLGVTGAREQGARSFVFVVDEQTALVLKYLRDSGAVIDIVLRARGDGGTSTTQPVDLGYLITRFGIKK